MSRINNWFLLLTAFFLPLSTTASTISALLCLLGWLLGGNYRKDFQEITANPMSRVVLLYLALLALGLLWNQHLAESLPGIQKQWKMLLMPVFLVIMQPQKRQQALWAFISGMTLAVCTTYAAWLGFIHYPGVPEGQLTPKTSHVVYNPMLALAIYLVLSQALWGLWQRWQKLALALLALLMTVSMFMTNGRTGQVVFFVLLGLLLLQYFSKKPWKACLLIFIALPAFCYACYHLSGTFKNRVDLAREEIAIYHENPKTSVGQRFFFWKQSLEIFQHSPVLGVGTGGFGYAYSQHNQKFSPSMQETNNPHNQYIFALVQTGIVGLIVLLALFVTQFRLAWREKSAWARPRCALPIFFLVIMLMESYLLIHETGILFSLMSAIFYKEAPPEKRLEAK